MLGVQKMWSDLGLHVTLDKAAKAERRDGTRLSDRALALVANRLMAPGSEHALARWLESDFVCDRMGRRFVAAWRKGDVRKASSTPRVRVEMRQLKQWYRTLDELLARKNDIEHALFVLLRDLFSLEVDMVFYDLDLDLFRRQGTAGVRRQWLQPRWQATQRASAGWLGHGRRLANRPSCVSG
jgi:hypothetical protein